ncbi:MAG: response regulator transcription factor [Bacteroidales bacterium]|nr:response regulator transcription factor [Bacteroidales bacterium]
MSVFIVDDHNLFREGLKFLLSNCSIIGSIYEANCGKQFLEQLDTLKPDVVLMDIEMPEMNGIETTQLAMSKCPDLKVIALSMYSYENYYSQMIDAGAKGFLLKNSKFEMVEHAILEVYSGNNYFSNEILVAILSNLNKKKSPKKISILSEREIEILFNICKGLSNSEISELLSISKRTVDKHRENLLLKTESKNTAGLVIYAIKNGIFEI